MRNSPKEIRSELKTYMNDVNENTLDLLISSITKHNPMISIEETVAWLKKLNNETVCEVHKIPLNKMEKWYFDEKQNIRQKSGKFFSIEGVYVRVNDGLVPEWSQPIIHQPEIGILGILCQKRDGILYFLMQAKIEPGNVNNVQLSPTLQATKSNFTRVHKGSYPLFLEYFLCSKGSNIIVDQLQSEQGARFLKKRNRNMIIEIEADKKFPLPDNYCWLTLWQLKELIKYDNLVNMDARTVLSCIPVSRTRSLPSQCLKSENYVSEKFKLDLIDSLFMYERASHTIEEIISWLTGLKMNTALDVTRCGINELSEWEIHEYDISHVEGKYFQIIGVQVNIGTREVNKWCQPLIRQIDKGIIGFVIKKINNVYHFLVQAKLEIGNFDILEMAPTVQCITGSYTKPEYEIPYLEYFIQKGKGKIMHDSLQSEEGGRFFHEQNRYVVIEVEDEFSNDVKERYIWMTLGQVKDFIKFNNYFNIEARSLIACISPI